MTADGARMTPRTQIVAGGVAAALVAAGLPLGAVAVAHTPLVLLGSAVMLAGAAPRRTVAGLAAGVAAGAATMAVRSAALPATARWDALALAAVVLLVALVAAGLRLPASAALVGAAVTFVATDPGTPLSGVETARLLPALVAAAWGAAAAGGGLAAGAAFDRFTGRATARPADGEVGP